MKRLQITMLTGLLLVCGTSAQVIVPPGAKGAVIRPIGGHSSGSVNITPGQATDEQKVRYTTHLVLTDLRQWTSTDGKTLQARLIAFEDLVAETPKGAAAPAAPVPPANPTVVKGGKIRLVSVQKPFELSLDRLSQADRDFVERVRSAHAKK